MSRFRDFMLVLAGVVIGWYAAIRVQYEVEQGFVGGH